MCKWSVWACSFGNCPNPTWSLRVCLSLTPPGQCWTPAPQLQRCHGQKKILSSWCHPPRSGGLSEPGGGGGEEQVMSKLSPQNNTFSFGEAGRRRLKTKLGKKYSVEITKETRGACCTMNGFFSSSGACACIQKTEMCMFAALPYTVLLLNARTVASMTITEQKKIKKKKKEKWSESSKRVWPDNNFGIRFHGWCNPNTHFRFTRHAFRKTYRRGQTLYFGRIQHFFQVAQIN